MNTPNTASGFRSRVLCSYSGIEFTCEHLPLHLESRETAHPVFFLPSKKLVGLYSLYQQQKLSPTEEYLLFLAYLNSTELVEFRVPAKYTANTQAVIASHMDALVEICTRLQTIKSPRFVAAKIAITPATSSLDNIKHWIANWNESFAEFLRGQDRRELLDSLADMETRLTRLTNAQSKQAAGKYNTLLAEWAAKAFSFPQFLIEDNGKLITLSNYWKLIIRCCQQQERIFQFPKEDIVELRDHLLDTIEQQPKWGIDVLRIVEEGLDLHSSFLGLGDLDLAASSKGGAKFTILTDVDDVQVANVQAILQNAPTAEPQEANYPTRFAYLKAKANWTLAQSYAPQAQAQAQETDTTNEEAN